MCHNKVAKIIIIIIIIIIMIKRVYCNCRRVALYEAVVNKSTAVSQVFCLKINVQ